MSGPDDRGDRDPGGNAPRAVVVNDSSFMRAVVSNLLSDAGITVVGKASNDREPYSAAMLACDDPEIDEQCLSVLGTDTSDEALENPRKVCYHTTRITDIAAELEPLSAPKTWVDRDGDSFRVREKGKEFVEFERHDLIRDGRMSAFDVVLCRNLLSSISSGQKGDVFDTLGASLSPESVLVAGLAESVPPDRRDRYNPITKRHRVCRRT